MEKENKELEPMHFISSNGDLYVNQDGTIHNDSEIEDWLLDISKVDIEEINNYYKLNGLGKVDCGDVLDFGWWDNNGAYNKPEKSWRMEIFHSQEFSDIEVEEIVKKSFEWIEKNR